MGVGGLYDDLPPSSSSLGGGGDSVRQQQRLGSVSEEVSRAGEASSSSSRVKRTKRDNEDDGEMVVDVVMNAKLALERIAPHMRKSGDKFAKAASMVERALREYEADRSCGAALYACLENAMMPTATRACETQVRLEYERLFEIVAAFAPVVFNVKQKKMVECWATYARRVNALYTDDSFAFNEAVKVLMRRVESCEKYVEIEAFDVNAFVDAHEMPPLPDGTSEAEVREAKAAYARAAEAEHAASMRDASVAEATREALVYGLEVALSLYSRPWAQTTIDMMSNHFHEHRNAFSPSGREKIEHLWEEIKRKKVARTTGGGQSAGMTSFERDSARAAGSNISARGAVGSENIKDGRGESAFR